MKKLRKRSFKYGLSLLLFCATALAASYSVRAADSGPATATQGSAGLQIQTFKTHSRISIAIDESVETQWKNENGGFELFLKGIGFTDLGAPLGEEDAWVGQFKAVRDPRLASIDFKEVPGGLKVSGSWRFPSGKDALAHPLMETFDFRKNEPARFVLDFWVKEGPTVAQVKTKADTAARQAALKKADDATRSRAARRLASEKRKAELEDITRFCRDPLDEKSDIFLPILPLHEKVRFSRWFPVTTADAGYHYLEPEKSDSKEIQYVRLALNLYRQGRPALVLKTLDFLDGEFPKSAHRAQMKFLRANAMIKLGMNDEAERILARIMTEEKDDAVSLPAAEYLAAKQYARGQYLPATETFLWLAAHYPTNRLIWVFHLGTAESLYALKETERGAKEYQWIIENAAENSEKAEAALRQGDLYMERLQYEQGLASYFQGVNYFKDEAKSFPSIFVNRGEALYGLGQFDRAKETFEAFLKDYPAHPAGWRAAFRIAEIEGRKSGDEARQASRKWFYETINRYPTSPGATLARLRLIPCGDHAGFGEAALERYFDTDAEKFDGGGQVVMPKYRAFRSLARIRTYIALGREPDAVELATSELATTTNPELRSILGSALGAVFRKSVLSLLAQGKRYEALSLYDDKYAALPKPDLVTDPEYLLKLSQTAADLGLGELASKISDAYKKADAAQKAGARNVANSEPGSRDLESELRGSEKDFTEAKGLYVGSGAAPAAKVEGRIRELLGAVKEESRFSYERELILGLLDEKRGELPAALAHAVKAQILAPANDGHDYRLDSWLASLQARAGDAKASLEMYRNLEKHLSLETSQDKPVGSSARRTPPATEVLGVPPVPSFADVLIAQAEILEKLNRWGESAATYARARDAGVGGTQVIYSYARALLHTGDHGDRAKGYDVLRQLADGKIPEARGDARKPAGGKPQVDATAATATTDFWRKLAREALENEKSRLEISVDQN